MELHRASFVMTLEENKNILSKKIYYFYLTQLVDGARFIYG